MDNIVHILQGRGLFEAMTSPDLESVVRAPVTVYAGFDPSSSSLQVGNLAAIMALAHFQRAGHRVIALVGGATGLIGDPSGKSAERPLLTREQVDANLEGIRENLGRFLDFRGGRAPATIVNNNDWMQRFSFVDFLRDVGKHFRMGTMLGKESVRARLEGEEGMSFAEFSYQLLQAYDFLHLWDTETCRLQIGGSDQWGNITAGVDLIRRLRGQEAYGLTLPLICDSSGRKFGKSEGNAVSLDERITPCYEFYQFFVRTEDADVERFLRVFTVLPLEEIAELERQRRAAPEERCAQKRLAEEVTRAVHGARGVEQARRASEALFGGEVCGFRADELQTIFAHVPSVELPRSGVVGRPLPDLAVAAGLCRSKGEARRLLSGGGLYLNNRAVGEAGAVVADGDLIEGRLLVLRSGKKTYCLVKAV